MLSGSLAGGLPAGGLGWGLEFGLGLRGIPLMLGIRAGDVYLGGSSQSGPTVGTISDSGVDVTSTTVSRTLELRHLELTARIEPPWQHVRPFVEGSVGGAALWHTTSVDGGGTEIDHWEEQRGIGFSWGASVGLDILPWCRDYSQLGWKAQGQGALCLGFTLGFGTWSVGPIDMGQVQSNGSGVSLAPDSGSLHEWVSYVALTFAFEGRPGAPPAPADD